MAHDGSPSALTPREIEMLEFERQRWKYPGAKETAILDRFGVSATRYYAQLHRLLERPDALAYDAPTVRRLVRLRDARRRQRATSRSSSTRLTAP